MNKDKSPIFETYTKLSSDFFVLIAGVLNSYAQVSKEQLYNNISTTLFTVKEKDSNGEEVSSSQVSLALTIAQGFATWLLIDPKNTKHMSIASTIPNEEDGTQTLSIIDFEETQSELLICLLGNEFFDKVLLIAEEMSRNNNQPQIGTK